MNTLTQKAGITSIVASDSDQDQKQPSGSGFSNLQGPERYFDPEGCIVEAVRT